LEGDWCLFEGAIRVSIFHSRKGKKKKEKITKPKKRIKKNEKQKTLIYEN
jgi:hypothetical protein